MSWFDGWKRRAKATAAAGTTMGAVASSSVASSASSLGWQALGKRCKNIRIKKVKPVNNIDNKNWQERIYNGKKKIRMVSL